MNARIVKSVHVGFVAVGLIGALPMLAQAQECPVGRFRAEYYKGDKRMFTTCESTIRYNWHLEGPRPRSVDDKSDAPAALAVGTDDFRVTWSGTFSFLEGTYTFVVKADDGVRLKVDGATLIDEWRDQAATEFKATKGLSDGMHQVDVEYFESTGEASITVKWTRSSP